MKKTLFFRFVLLTVLSALAFAPAYAQGSGDSKAATVSENSVRAHMEFLASDAMQGRGSGTQFERLAGEYLSAMMRRSGITPAGDELELGKRTYIQTVEIRRNTFAAPPTLSYSKDGSTVTLTHGKEIVAFRLSSGSITGGLKKVGADGVPVSGSVTLVRNDGGDESAFGGRIGSFFSSGAAAVLIEETAQIRSGWERFASRPVSFSEFATSAGNFSTAVFFISKEAAEALGSAPDGTEIVIAGELGEPQISHTWNAVGMIEGSDPKLKEEVILLSAHMDHVGVRESARGDDKIYNGADDDATGCVAVLELAGVLSRMPSRPKRTVYFAFFGSEEAGGFGSRYFAANLPFLKKNFVANLQFEMIGRPDPKVAASELWLTGYEMSDLGAELAKNGANLVADPHPDQNFFQRSDNYTLARQGIIAHTVSSFGLHTDYHQPSDEVETIDFDHMTRAIRSMIAPVNWLVNSNFRPKWYEGKDPSQ